MGRALVIGASGFLGSRLLSLAPRSLDPVGTGFRRPVPEGRWRSATLDVMSPPAIRSLIERERPEVVVYCSYSTTDRIITVDGARVAAQAATAAGARYVFMSTDLVFDGEHAPYRESDIAMPVMVYGGLKVEAEVAVKDAAPTAVIIRPALMAGESRAIRRPAYEMEHLEAGHPVTLYADEWRTPVHVDDVARAVWDLAARDVSGTFHLGGPDRLSRVELGRLLCQGHGFDPALIREAKRPVDRPRDTSLDSSRLVSLLGWKPMPLAARYQLPAVVA